MTSMRCRWRSYSLFPSDSRKLDQLRLQIGAPDLSKAIRHFIRNSQNIAGLTGTYIGPRVCQAGIAERSELVNLSLSQYDTKILERLAAQNGLSNISQALRLVIRASSLAVELFAPQTAVPA